MFVLSVAFVWWCHGMVSCWINEERKYFMFANEIVANEWMNCSCKKGKCIFLWGNMNGFQWKVLSYTPEALENDVRKILSRKMNSRDDQRNFYRYIWRLDLTTWSFDDYYLRFYLIRSKEIFRLYYNFLRKETQHGH